MKKIIFAALAIAIFSICGFGQNTQPAPSTQAAPRPTPAPLTLKVGDMAPDFTLPATDGTKVKLSDFRGKSNVVLAFYVLAFTGG
jgi:cytochrome oxidase Cu insertion factor (SCO1/SenC/PrrC family)